MDILEKFKKKCWATSEWKKLKRLGRYLSQEHKSIDIKKY